MQQKQLAVTSLFCSLSGSSLMNFTLYCQSVVVAEMTVVVRAPTSPAV